LEKGDDASQKIDSAPGKHFARSDTFSRFGFQKYDQARFESTHILFCLYELTSTPALSLSHFSLTHRLSRSVSMIGKAPFDGFPTDAVQCKDAKATQSHGGDFFRFNF
jgi:hypothetical protein